MLFRSNDTATTEIYTLSLHDALPISRPEMRRPFRMWLYPLPALLASAGFLFILFNRVNWQKEVRYAALILLSGVIIYMVRAWKDSEWPFRTSKVQT